VLARKLRADRGSGYPARNDAIDFPAFRGHPKVMRIGFRSPLLPALGLVLLGLAPLAAQAPVQRVSLYDKFQFSLSLTDVILNSDFRIDGSGGNGTEVDAEDDLGMDQHKLQPRGGFRWRPGRRHEIELGYQFARRSSDRRLERPIEVADTGFTVGADLATTFNTDQAFLAYRFAFMAKERTQVGLALGLGALFLDVGMEAQIAGRTVAVSKSLTGPLGSLGLYGRFLAGDRWYFELEGRYVGINIDRFKIDVLEGGAAVRYHLSQPIGLELGWAFSGIEVNVDRKQLETGGEGIVSGRVKYSLQSIRFALVVVP